MDPWCHRRDNSGRWNGIGSNPNQIISALGLFVDDNLNIYVADEANFRVQKWSPGASEGITVAGGNGPGSAANQLYLPSDVFLDKQGNIYVADEGNNRVQKWVPDGQEGVTVAGGNGRGESDNQLDNPETIFLDSLNNIYIADYFNDRIQKWSPGNRTGTNIVGDTDKISGTTGLNGPLGIFLTNQGRLYVADQFNYRIQLFLPDSAHETLPDSTFTDNTGGIYRAAASFYNSSDAVSNKLAVTSLPRFTNINGQKRNLCEGGNFTYSVPAIEGASDYRWTVPQSFTLLSGQGTASIKVNIPSSGFNTGTVSVNAKNNCGRGRTFADTISTKPVRPDSIKGPSFVKLDDTVVFRTKPIAGINYQWEVPTGVIILSGQGTSRITVKWHHIESDYVYVRTKACAASSSQRLLVSLKAGNKNSREQIVINAINKNINPQVKVFPNPSNNIAIIQIQSAGTSKYTIELTDLAGRVLLRKQMNTIKGVNETQIDVSTYPKGVYLIKVHNGIGKSTTLKLIK